MINSQHLEELFVPVREAALLSPPGQRSITRHVPRQVNGSPAKRETAVANSVHVRHEREATGLERLFGGLWHLRNSALASSSLVDSNAEIAPPIEGLKVSRK